MLFRIQTTDSGWIIEGGDIRSDGDFIPEYTDVATDEDQIGPIMNQFNEEEDKEQQVVEEKRKATEAAKPKKTMKKKTAKKKVAKKKPVIVEPDHK